MSDCGEKSVGGMSLSHDRLVEPCGWWVRLSLLFECTFLHADLESLPIGPVVVVSFSEMEF